MVARSTPLKRARRSCDDAGLSAASAGTVREVAEAVATKAAITHTPVPMTTKMLSGFTTLPPRTTIDWPHLKVVDKG
jgi:hypothetical protein